MEVCAEKRSFLANPFEHKMIHRYTWRRVTGEEKIGFSDRDVEISMKGIVNVRGLFMRQSIFVWPKEYNTLESTVQLTINLTAEEERKRQHLNC